MTHMANRIRKLPPYLFARIDKIKQDALAEGVDVIDLGVGDPDISPPHAIVDSLIESVQKEGSHHYSSYEGLPELRSTFAQWFRKRFDVNLDPDTEILPLIGSKEGIGHIFFSHVDPGDEVLIPDPGYPVYTSGVILAGATPKYFPLRQENEYLPDIKELESFVSQKTKMIWLNYPSNPTTAMATADTFREIIVFAHDRDILVCHDAAYSEIVFDGNKSTSILQIPGAKEVAVEYHSLSKTFCMPGWRVGFVVGNAEVISSLSRVKTNLDSGIFLPIQHAAITALTECEEEAKQIRGIFESRRNQFVGGLRDMGWDIQLPSSTFYVWAPIPDNTKSMDFCMRFIKGAGIVCTPGVGFGENSEGYIRMSLTIPGERLEEALARIRNMNLKWS